MSPWNRANSGATSGGATKNPTRRSSAPKNFVNDPVAQSPGCSTPRNERFPANSRNVSSTRTHRAPAAHSRTRARSHRSPSGFRG